MYQTKCIQKHNIIRLTSGWTSTNGRSAYAILFYQKNYFDDFKT